MGRSRISIASFVVVAGGKFLSRSEIVVYIQLSAFETSSDRDATSRFPGQHDTSFGESEMKRGKEAVGRRARLHLFTAAILVVTNPGT